MTKIRNLINKVITKYTNFKQKLVAFKGKILKNIYYYTFMAERKINRFKIEISIYCDNILEKIAKFRQMIHNMIQLHRVNKVYSLESKIDKLESKINNL